MRVDVAVIVVMFVGSSAFAQTNWELVTSKEGGFSVEMPTKPTLKNSRTRKENGGVTKVMQIGCENNGGAYIVQKIAFPSAIVKGAENQQLDAERDSFAEAWRGKVISEKKVRSTDYITGEAPLSRLQQVLHHMMNRNGDIKTAIIPGH